MEPSSPPIYRNLHSLDRFRKHVEENLVPGTLAQRPSGHGAPVRYIPTPTQSKYWTQAHVREVILATRDLDLLIEDICTNYFQVFSILVWISTTGCSYIRYMEKFIQYRVDNTSLPLQDVPKFLTSAIDDQNFYRIFSEHQFMFCPVDLTAGTMRNRILDPSLILPLKVERDLSTPTVGRPATVRLATLDQASVPKLSGSSYGQVVLKSYPSKARTLYDRELRAFTAFANANNSENILRCLGSYQTQPSAPENDATYTVILEFADRGTLLDLYGANSPPITFGEAKAFWSRLRQVVKALMLIHHDDLPTKNNVSCVHQDLKPSNILVFSRDSKGAGQDFEILFKVGDFGNSHVRLSGPHDRGEFGYDTGSTRSYCPPELNYNDDATFLAGPSVDMWSLGCILLEAAVWMSFGEPERIQFRNRREKEIETGAPNLLDQGRGQCFHNGSERLQSVQNVAMLVARDGRRSDRLTPRIVKLVTECLLVDEGQRLNARQFLSRLDNAIEANREPQPGQYSGVYTDSVASSADLSQRSRETYPSHFYDGVDPFHSTLTSPSSETNWRSTQGQGLAWPMEDLQHGSHSPQSRLSTQSSRLPTIHVNTDPQEEPWNSQTAARGIPETNPASRSETLSLAEPAQVFSSSTPDLRRPTTLLGMNDTNPYPQHLHGGTHRKISFRSAVSSGDNMHSAGNSRPHSQTEIHRQEENGYDMQSHFDLETGTSRRHLSNGTDDSSGTVRPRKVGPENLRETLPRPTFPRVTMAEVEKRREQEKRTKYRGNLAGEDRAMDMFLMKREHIILIDNSKSMQRHEAEVVQIFANLAHVLEKADDNGLDVFCTSAPTRPIHSSKTDRLVNWVNENFAKGSMHRCFIEQSLQALTDKIIADLPRSPGDTNGGFSIARIVTGKRTKGRPVSIYVLTNGVWNQDPAARDGVCGADQPIKQLIRELKARNLSKSQVAFQFIRFGSNETGTQRLTFLDDGLKGDPNYKDHDIVDHKASTDDLWPILIGSLDEGVDREGGVDPDG